MERHEVLVVGAGNAGVSLAARLLRDGAADVAIACARQVHCYRPLLNYVEVARLACATSSGR